MQHAQSDQEKTNVSKKGTASMARDKVQEIASKGGHASATQAGHEGMAERGSKGGHASAERAGHEGMAERGRKGGQTSGASRKASSYDDEEE